MVWCLILNLLNRDKLIQFDILKDICCVPRDPGAEKIFISVLVVQVVILSEEVKFVIAHIHTFRLHILVLINLFACLHVVHPPVICNEDCKLL